YVVDETNSIYVFGSDIAAAVSVGNTVTIAGIRANYVLETEQFYAELHGYQGALQLSNARLIEKENTQTAFDTSWIEEKTIRDIMQTDFQTENLTTTIFKTKAYIHKVPG